MIDLAILGLLEETDLHGYELRKRLGELPGTRAAVSFGSLYPALARLERAGHVKAVTTTTAASMPAAPMSGSLAGELAAFRAHRRNRPQGNRGTRGTRGKKVYGITDEGRRRLHDLLIADDAVVDDRGFALRLVFCHHLTSSERLALFERRRDQLIRQRDQQQQRTGPRSGALESRRRLNTYLRSLLERDTQAINADLAWIERLIAAEQGEDSTQDHDRGLT